MSDSSAAPSFPGSIRVSVEGLDPLLIATALAVASLTPGPAGEAGAVAAIAYDIKQKRWYGVALSGASMIPVFGYIPAFVKVGLLIFLVNRRLKNLEAMLPEIQGSPEASLMVESVLGKYYRKLPDIWITRPLRKRLGRIMGLNKPSQDKPSQSVPCAPTDGASEDNSISAKIPE